MSWKTSTKIAALAIFTLLIFASQTALAQDGASTGIQTQPQDLGYGDVELSDEARFSTTMGLRGRVDRRGEYNPLADRTIGWSTGYIAPRGTIQLSNTMLIGQRLAYSASDDLQIFASAYLPLSSQSYLSAGLQSYVADGENWTMTVGVQGRYRRTNYIPGTSDAGLGVHAVFDVIATDDTSWNIGISANVPLYRMVDQFDLAECDNRYEAGLGQCGVSESNRDFMPDSGYWAALYLGVNHFAADWLVLNAEIFTGLSQGNFFALESALETHLSFSEEQQIVEDGDFRAGLGPLGPVNLGLGTTFRFDRFAIKGGLFFTNFAGDGAVLPHVTMAYNFGGY